MNKLRITKDAVDWVDIKNKCRTTVNKKPTDNIPNSDFKINLLISEHSPIRLGRIGWSWVGIKSWVATHFARHWLGWDKFISTQRTDRTGIDRDSLTQDAQVNMDVEANIQALINVSRVRLCTQSAVETRKEMCDLKASIYNIEPEISDVMVPNCVYRCGCPEFKECGFWTNLKLQYPDIVNASIRDRYEMYNQYFYEHGYNE